MTENIKDNKKVVISQHKEKANPKPKKSPEQRELIPASTFKHSVRNTFINTEYAADDVYTMAEICKKFNYKYGRFYNLRMRYSIPCVKGFATKCFPKAAVEKAMAAEEERIGNTLSEHWYSCFDIMRLYGLGKTQVHRFASTHGVRTKRINKSKQMYLKEDWDAAREKAESISTSTKKKREPHT